MLSNNQKVHLNLCMLMNVAKGITVSEANCLAKSLLIGLLHVSKI